MASFRMRDLLPATALGFAVIATLVAVHLRPNETGLRAEVYDPRLSLSDIILQVSAAGGQVVGNGAYDNVVLVLRPSAGTYKEPKGLLLSVKAEGMPGCSPNKRIN